MLRIRPLAHCYFGSNPTLSAIQIQLKYGAIPHFTRNVEQSDGLKFAKECEEPRKTANGDGGTIVGHRLGVRPRVPRPLQILAFLSRMDVVNKGPAAVWDTVALLTLFNSINQTGDIPGNLKVQKVAFLAELAGQRSNLRVAHFRFFRYTNGPYSAQLTKHVGNLEEAGALTRNRVLTARGKYLLDYAAAEIKASKAASDAVDILTSVGTSNANLSGTELMHRVYDMKVPVVDWNNQKCRVLDIPHFTDILDPVRDINLQEIEPFDSDTLDEFQAELGMDLEKIDRDSLHVKRAAAAALKRVATACP